MKIAKFISGIVSNVLLGNFYICIAVFGGNIASVFGAGVEIKSVDVADSVIVINGAEGTGCNRKEALDEALRNSIRMALGKYAYTRDSPYEELYNADIFENLDKVISGYKIVRESSAEAVLSPSRIFSRHNAPVGEEESGAALPNSNVTVLADVQIDRKEMENFISQGFSGRAAAGGMSELLIKRETVKNALAALDFLRNGFLGNMFRVERYGDFTISDKDRLSNEVVVIRIPFVIAVDKKSEKIFCKRLKSIVEYVALSKRKVSLASPPADISEIIRNFSAKNRREGRLVAFAEDSAFELFIVPSQIFDRIKWFSDTKVGIRFLFFDADGNTIFSEAVPTVFSYYSDRWWMPDIHGLERPDGSGVYFGAPLINPLNERGYTKRTHDSFMSLCYADVKVPEFEMPRIAGDKARCEFRKGPVDYKVMFGSKLNSEEWKNFDDSDDTFRFRMAVKSDKYGEVVNRLNDLKRNQSLEAAYELDRTWREVLSCSTDVPKHVQEYIYSAICALCYAKGNVQSVEARKNLFDAKNLWTRVSVKCGKCHGKKMQICDACKNEDIFSGKLGVTGKCTNCDGKGRVTSKKMNLSLRCAACEGSGLCCKCKGKGKIAVNCGVCDGKGRILSREECRSVFEQSLNSALFYLDDNK